MISHSGLSNPQHYVCCGGSNRPVIGDTDTYVPMQSSHQSSTACCSNEHQYMLLQVASASIMLSDSSTDSQPRQIACCNLEQLSSKVRLSPDTTHAEVILQEMTVLDMTQCSDSSADAVLGRWQQPGTTPSPDCRWRQVTSLKSMQTAGHT